MKARPSLLLLLPCRRSIFGIESNRDRIKSNRLIIHSFIHSLIHWEPNLTEIVQIQSTLGTTASLAFKERSKKSLMFLPRRSINTLCTVTITRAGFLRGTSCLTTPTYLLTYGRLSVGSKHTIAILIIILQVRAALPFFS